MRGQLGLWWSRPSSRWSKFSLLSSPQMSAPPWCRHVFSFLDHRRAHEKGRKYTLHVKYPSLLDTFCARQTRVLIILQQISVSQQDFKQLRLKLPTYHNNDFVQQGSVSKLFTSKAKCTYLTCQKTFFYISFVIPDYMCLNLV